MDTLGAMHERLLDFATRPENGMDLGILGPLLDEFGREITTVVVVGTETREAVNTSTQEVTKELGFTFGLSDTRPHLGIDASARNSEHQGRQIKVAQAGSTRHRVHFGGVGQVLSRIIENLDRRRIWVLLDEWSVVPNDVQPLLADLLRRSLLPLKGITVKIGAIEQRSTLQIVGDRGDYTGIELGADVAADVNLDDFIVFENDAARATEFFQELIYRHYKSAAEDLGFEIITSSSELVRLAFTQRNVFDEFVRAAEGVPRDAIYILGIAAQRAFDEPISVFHIRSAAKTWYQRDKEAPVAANSQAREFLHWIIDEVIAHRRARAFLFQSNTRHPLIDTLFDARVQHLLKRNISAHDEPGVRYDVYKIDYGCYVDLLTTLKAPQGLLPSGDGGDNDLSTFFEVPPDDYRAIRRAILDPSRFEDFRDSMHGDNYQ
jgi:hypothetical protein